MARLHVHPAAEDQLLDQLDERVAYFIRNRDIIAKNTPMVQRVEDWGKQHPVRHEDVVVAAGLAGIDSNNIVAQQVGTRDGRKQLQEGQWWDDVGRTAMSAATRVMRYMWGLKFAPEETEQLREMGVPIVRTATAPLGMTAAAIPERGRELGKAAVRTLAVGMEGAFQEMPGIGAQQIRDNLDMTFAAINGQTREEYRAERQREILEHGPDVSAARLAIQAAIRGEPIELGEGFLGGRGAGTAAQQAGLEPMPEPTLVEQSQQGAEGRRIGVAGRETPISLGRALAVLVADPESELFDWISAPVDFGYQVLADPTAIFGGGLGKLRKAKKLFIPDLPDELARRRLSNAGLIRGMGEKRIIGTEYNKWLRNTKEGQAFVGEAVKTTDPYDLWTRLDRRIPRDVAVRLAESPDADSVIGVMDESIKAGQIRSTTQLNVKPRPEQARILPHLRTWYSDTFKERMGFYGDMPEEHLNPHDFDQAARVIDDNLLNAKVRKEVRADIVGRALRAPREQWETMVALRDEAQLAIYDRLTTGGTPQDMARRLTQSVKGFEFENRAFAYDELGNPLNFPGASTYRAGGKEHPLASAQLRVEYTDNAIPFATAKDVRDIRRETSIIAPVYRHPLSKIATFPHDAFLAPVTNNLWKAAVLLRAAIVPRVVGEEQIRMGQSGLDSLAYHPMQYFAWLSAESEDGLRGLANKVLRTGRKGDPDIEKFAEAMSVRGAGYTGDTRRSILDNPNIAGHADRSRVFKSRIDRKTYLDVWGGELGKLSADEIARRAAGGLSPEDMATLPKHLQGAPAHSREALHSWLLHGGGREELEAIARGGPRRSQLLDPDKLWKYLDVVDERLLVVTRGNPDLLDAVANSRLGDVDLRLSPHLGARTEFEGWDNLEDLPRKERKVVERDRNTAVREVLDGYYDGGPDVLWGPRELVNPEHGIQRLRRLDGAINAGFQLFMSRPTNFASRITSARQYHANRLQELMRWADESTQGDIMVWLRDHGLGKRADELQRQIADGRLRPGDGLTSFDQADHLAASYAIQSTKDLLYDVSRRGNLSDIMRAFIPFMEPWKEVMGTWARITRDSYGKPIRRMQQVVTSGERAGTFQRNEQGDLMFTYPLVGSLTAALTGLPGESMEAQGRLSGLNMIGNVFPGFGPAVQIPAAWLFEKAPSLRMFTGLVFPFAEPDVQSMDDLAKSVMPAWARKGFEALFAPGKSEGLVGAYGDHWMETARLLEASGDFDLSTTEGQADFQRAVDRATRRSLVYRMAAQFFLPTGPEFDFRVEDKDGTWFSTQVLGDWMRKKHEEYGGYSQPDSWFRAYEDFVNTFGFEPHLMEQGRSKAKGVRAQTKEGQRWEERNPDLVDAFPNTLGFFSPEPADDQELGDWNRLLEQGSREPLSREEVLQAAANRRDYAIYNFAKRQTEAEGMSREDAQAYLADVRAAIHEQNPRWGDGGAIEKGMANDAMERELRKVVQYKDHPELRNNPTTRGLVIAFDAIDQAQAEAQTLGRSDWRKSQDTQHLRDWLAEVFDAIIAEHPESAPAIQRVWLQNNDIKWAGEEEEGLIGMGR